MSIKTTAPLLPPYAASPYKPRAANFVYSHHGEHRLVDGDTVIMANSGNVYQINLRGDGRVYGHGLQGGDDAFLPTRGNCLHQCTLYDFQL